MVVCCLPEDLSGADLAVRVVGAIWVPTGSLGRPGCQAFVWSGSASGSSSASVVVLF